MIESIIARIGTDCWPNSGNDEPLGKFHVKSASIIGRIETECWGTARVSAKEAGQSVGPTVARTATKP